ncbi:WD repeat-containing protein 60 [Echinococcus granulosus]|nr:WD repeat-containing protein 60 [Echinococcus granulosus]
MSDRKSRRHPLRSCSTKKSNSKSKSPAKSAKASVNLVASKGSSAEIPNIKTSRLPTVSNLGSVTEQYKEKSSIRRSRLPIGMSGNEPLSSINHSNADSSPKKESCSQDCKLESDFTLLDPVSPQKGGVNFPAESSLGELEYRSAVLPTNQNAGTLENQQIMTPSDFQYFTVYACNGEQTKRNCSKSPTQMRIENDIAESLSNEFMSLNRRRQIERGKELLRIIELGLGDFREIFNLQPMDAYSSYVLRLCQVELSHAQSQTMDDCLSREVQTERSRTAPYSSWTQIPPAYEGGHSGHVRYAPLNSSFQSNHSSDSPRNNERFSVSTLNRLKTSLKTVLMLLEGDCEEHSLTSNQHAHKPHNLVIPSQDQQTLAELECVHCKFLDHHLLTLHRLKSPHSMENLRGPLPGDLACVWKVNDHSGQGTLEHALKCPGLLPMSGRGIGDVWGYGDGIVSVLSETSSEFTMIVGGLSDGTLVVWAIGSEISPLYPSDNVSKQGSFLPKIFEHAKSPDYLASFAFSEEDKSSDFRTFPTSPIVALKSLMRESILSNSFQFCSLDNRGNVNIWMALRLQPKRSCDIIGPSADLGLRPGGRARLIQLARFTYDTQGSHLRPVSSGINVSLAPFTTCLEVCRTSDKFFIGSADGNIRQKCRVPSQCIYPRDFKLSFADAAVTCLALHPFLPNVLIAGYSDGQLALYLTHHPHPIFKWLIKVQSDRPSIGVRKVIWSPHRPNVTYCLATDGDIIAWTLLDGEQATMKPRAQTLIIGTIRERRVVDFSVARGCSGCLAVCWQDGAEIHWLKEDLVVRQEDELLALESVLNGLL